MKALLYLLVIIPTFFNFIQSRIITLDDIGDQETGVWTEISCRHYLNSLEYLDATGCYVSAMNLSDHRWQPENETDFFEGQEGFWGPCSKQTCDLIYYGGFLPQPINISVSGIFSGDGTIEVSTRRGASYGQWRSLSTLQAIDTDDSFTTSWQGEFIDSTTLTETDYVFKFTVSTTGPESLALIDRIEIDLGPDVLEPPTTTTENPLDPRPPKNVFELDVKEELELDSEWMSVTCNYAPSHEDFWAYGCPNNMSLSDEEDQPLGFWTTCHAYNCDFIFSAGAGRPQIQLLTMNGLFRGDAKVTISKKARGLSKKYEHMLSVTAADFYNSTSWAKILPNYCNSDIYNISISGAANNILVDKVLVSLYQDSDKCTTPVATKPTTPIPGTGATEPNDEDETTKGGVQSITSTFMTFAFVVCTSLSFYAFSQ